MLLMTAAFMLARTGRDALYFQDGGIQSLPLAYMGVALLALPMAAVLLSLVLAGVGIVGTPGGSPAMTLFFMLVPVVFGGLFSLAWLLAGEIIGRDSPDLAGRSAASARPQSWAAFSARASPAAWRPG